jgi:hypothetical protein
MNLPPNTPDAVAAVEPPDGSRDGRMMACDLDIRVARSLPEIVDAWGLVYTAYRRIGIIDANDSELHTSEYAINPQTSVVIGCTETDIASTLTIMHDSPRGLPLDKAYPGELAALRERGERLMEVGLLADRRAKMARSIAAIFGMMRYVFYNSRFTSSKILCGVHPHHAGFYMKSFGFEQAGPESTHPTVKEAAVVLLRLDLNEKLQATPMPRGLFAYVANPLPADTFESRFPLTKLSIADTPIQRFLTQPPMSLPSSARIAG